MRGEAAFMLLWFRVDWQVKHHVRNHSERSTAKASTTVYRLMDTKRPSNPPQEHPRNVAEMPAFAVH